MKYSFTSLVAIAACIASANAHIKLKSPVPYRDSTSPPQSAPSKDFDMNAPLLPNGSNFPCKGYHKDSQGTQPLATWPAGSTQTMEFDGSANHGGGSCQASLSEDGGASFKVIMSYIGACPQGPETFVVPKEAKSGPVIFAWTWFNKLGNREMYMNCAAVTISGGGSGLSGFPDVFIANIGNGCTTDESTDVAFPNPGPNVRGSGGTPPKGNCGSGGYGGGNPPPATTSDPPASVPTPSTTTSPVPPPATSTQPTYPGPDNDDPAPIVPSPSPSTYTTPPATPTSQPSNPEPSNADPGTACVEGTVVCNSDGTWSQCGSGYMQNMGQVAAGMVCKSGNMVSANERRALRFSREHLARRHSYAST